MEPEPERSATPMNAASNAPGSPPAGGEERAHPPIVLTIAGSDSSAGAGIQADIRTIHALGGYAATAVTAVTAQNTEGVIAWRAVTPALITAQIEAVLGDLGAAAVKTGLLPSAAAARAVARALPAGMPLIVDPVITSSSGTRFLSAGALRVVRRELLPRAMLVTPNWPEAAALTGLPVGTPAEAEAAARALLATGCRAVLIKGGHGPEDTCEDVLATAAGHAHQFRHPRIYTPNTHGTGCVLSAAIAALVAHGEPIARAVERAISLLTGELERGRNLRWGRGRGPAFPHERPPSVDAASIAG